jgi:hypothetical protein
MITYLLHTRGGDTIGTLTTARTTWGLGDMFYTDDGSHVRLLATEFTHGVDRPMLVVERLPERW